MKYHIHLLITLFMFCNLVSGDFPEQREANLSTDNARQAKRKAKSERAKRKREENPELLAQYKAKQDAANERARRKRKEDPKLLAQYKAKQDAANEIAKRKRKEDPELLAQYKAKQDAANEIARRKRKENPELLAQYKAKQKVRDERKKQKREKGLEATTPSQEFYSFFPPQNLEEENLPIKSLEELNREWLKNQLDDLSDSPKPKLYPSWDDLLSDEEK